MVKYVIKRILLLFFTLFVIMTVCFVLVKLLEPNEILDVTQAEREEAIREALTAAGGDVRKAADMLGLTRQNLHHKLKQYRLE